MFKYLSILILTLFISNPLVAKDLYSGPSNSEYFESLKQPDNTEASCCGEHDAYWADKTEPCPIGVRNCALIAIITDSRPDTRVLPNGKILTRVHIPVGTKIIIPPSKIRKHPIPNPTDHNIVFSNSYHDAYCWEPATGI